MTTPQTNRLYGVTRNWEFVNDMSNILSISNNEKEMQRNLFFSLHNGGDVKLLAKFLITYSDKVDLSLCDAHGMNAYHYCCYFGNVKMFELLKNVARDDNKLLKKCLTMPTSALFKQYCLQLAIKSGNSRLVEIMVELGSKLSVKFNEQVDGEGRTALASAVKAQNIDVVRILLDSKAFSVNDKIDPRERYALNLCAWHDDTNLELFSYLLSQPDIDPNLRDDNGFSCIALVSLRGQLEYMQYLIENDGKYGWKLDDLDADTNVDGETILHCCARRSNTAVLRYLLTLDGVAETLLNARNAKGRTPLHSCALSTKEYDKYAPLQCENFKCFKSLLDQPTIDVNCIGDDGCSVFMDLVWKGKTEYVKYLIENSSNNNNNGKNGYKLEAAKDLNGVSVGYGFDKVHHENALHYAARASNARLMRYILDNVSNKDMINAHGTRYRRTPLSLCIMSTRNYDRNNERECDNYKCFKILLNHDDIDANKLDRNGYSPVLTCIWQDKVEYLKYMVKNDGKLWKLDEFWRPEKKNNVPSGLRCATGFCSIKCLKYILSLNIFTSSEISEALNSLTDLQKPRNHDFECFKLLLSQPGVDVNLKDHQGYCVFLNLVVHDKIDFVEYLFENNGKYGWKMNDVKSNLNKDKENALHLASTWSSFNVLDYLLNKTNIFNKYDINKKGGKYKRTPLSMCAMTFSGYTAKNELNCQNYKCFALLLSQNGIDPNIGEKNGFTCLLSCAFSDKIEFVKCLINGSKNNTYKWKLKNIKKQKSKWDANPLMCAARRSSVKTLKYFIDSSNDLFNIKDKSRALNKVCDTTHGYDEESPLKSDNFKCFKAILDVQGIDLNVKDKDSFRPLQNLVFRDKPLFIEYLVKHNGKKSWKIGDLEDEVTEKNENLLTLSAKYTSLQAMKYLLSLKIFNTTQDIGMALNTLCSVSSQHNGKNPLSENNVHFQCLNVLLTQDKHVLNVTDSKGRNAVMICMKSKTEYANYILEHCVEKKNNDDGKEQEDEKEFELVLDKKLRNNDGNDLLMLAAQYSNFKILSKIIEMNFYQDINCKNDNGDTAILLCAKSMKNYDKKKQIECENFQCFELLSQRSGCDFSVVNSKGESVVTACKSNGKAEYLAKIPM